MSKILREEVSDVVPSAGGMLDLLDGLMYTFYNITSDELDEICESATDEELKDFVDATTESATISIIRRAIAVRNKYVKYYQNGELESELEWMGP